MQYLFPHPAHLEIFPVIFVRLNGAVSSAVGGGCIWGKSANQCWSDGVHDIQEGMYDGPGGVMNKGP